MSKGLQQCFAMQQVVRLLGDLGDRYGAEHTYFNLRTPADAIKLLCINSPAFQEELTHAHEHGVAYRLIQAGTDLDLEDLQLPIGSNDLILTPVVAGSGGKGVGKVLFGAALIATAIFTGGTSIAFGATGFGLASGVAATTALSLSIAAGNIGLGLVLAGTAQLLSPQPTIPKLGGSNRLSSGESSSTDGPQGVVRGTDGRQSYAYTGAANTVGVGATIPVAYGEVLIGSHLLSANVDVADESDPLKTAIRDPGASTIQVGGEKIGFGSFESASGVKVKRSRKTLGSSNNRQKVANSFLDLRDGETETEGSINESTSRRERLDFIFELRDGLFDFVDAPGSTLVDGFFTYRITLENKTGGPDPIIATSQATVQGLLANGDNYKWIHRISHPDVEDEIAPTIEIIDHRANSKCTLFWQAYGYDLG
jgi:predicted phage tail protein